AAVSSFAQSNSKSYTTLSVKPEEIIVKVVPQYTETTVTDVTTGKGFTEMSFAGGVVTDAAGAPRIERLVLPLLSPNRQAAQVEVIDQSLEVIPNVDLAPVPQYVKSGDSYKKNYIVNDERY